MRIPCPFCGERDAGEFTYRGEARAAPDLSANTETHFNYVYQRDNPRGLVKERWYHAHGCRSWLIVERDLRTHEIFSAKLTK